MLINPFHCTGENKVTIAKRLEQGNGNLLLDLESWLDSENYIEREVGFCAQWCLDNLCKFHQLICSACYTVHNSI